MIGFLTLTQLEGNGLPGEEVSLNAERIDAVLPGIGGSVVVLSNGREIYVTESHDSVMTKLTDLLELFGPTH